MSNNITRPFPLVDEELGSSLTERVFDNPDAVSQGEYTAIYEFLLDPDIRDDPDLITGALEEFSGWAEYMLERLQEYISSAAQEIP